MKLVAILGLFALLASGIAWAVTTVQQNERLQTGLDAATVANQSQQAALSKMASLYAESQQQVADRDRRNANIERRLIQTKRELIDAKQAPQITIAERECMDSAIPAAVLGILRESESGHQPGATDQGVPGRGAVRGRALAAIFGQHMDRPRELHQNAASRVFKVEWRSSRDTGLL